MLCGDIAERRGAELVEDFERLVVRRYPASPTRRRIWELRATVTAYDATYVALAEHLRADALLTADARLATAPGPTCRIDLL